MDNFNAMDHFFDKLLVRHIHFGVACWFITLVLETFGYKPWYMLPVLLLGCAGVFMWTVIGTIVKARKHNRKHNGAK